MFWSDAMHLTDFGIAKLWSIYLLLGNLLKYIRAEPNSGATNYLAYISSLDDALKMGHPEERGAYPSLS